MERLQKTLARAGYGSRRGVEELIRAGRVQIGGRTAELGDRADPRRDQITVDGVPVPAHPGLRYLALNKPAGVTTTLRDRHAQRSVAELVPPGPRMFPVGRLDREALERTLTEIVRRHEVLRTSFANLAGEPRQVEPWRFS